MSPKKVTKKTPKTAVKQKQNFKFIKGCKELVNDPFNLNKYGSFFS